MFTKKHIKKQNDTQKENNNRFVISEETIASQWMTYKQREKCQFSINMKNNKKNGKGRSREKSGSSCGWSTSNHQCVWRKGGWE